jgi:DNA-binding FrmR family transcriptional regulator
MAHLARDKKKLINRVHRIRGQLRAIERDLEEERDCSETLRMIAACRGAMNGLMQQVLEGHIRHHVVDPRRKPSAEQARATEELLDVVKAYLR